MPPSFLPSNPASHGEQGRHECGPYNSRASLSACSAAATSDFIQRAPKIPTRPAITNAGVQVINRAVLKSWPAAPLVKCAPCVGSKLLARNPTSDGAKASPSKCAISNEMATDEARKTEGTTSCVAAVLGPE